MGTPVPPPVGYYAVGDDCPTCTPTLYESGEWPLFMYATFFDIIACPGHPDPPNGYLFRLEQNVNPCLYEFRGFLLGSQFQIQLYLATAYLHMFTTVPIARSYFYALAAPCSLYFPVNLRTCPTNGGTGGRGIVRPTPEVLPSLLTGPYNFMPWRQTMFEQADVAVDHTLIRLANKGDHSCCYFYVDREDLP